MANGINTDVPPWLERNWQPREPFDVTPWLAERYRRQVAAEEIPLRLQSMALQNQQTQLAIQQQAIGNEVAATELQQYQSELPVVAEWAKSTKGDPIRVLNDPTPSVLSPKLQSMILTAKKSAAQNTYAQQLEKYNLGLTEAATRLLANGVNVRPRLDANGQEYFDPEDIATAASKLQEDERIFILQKIKAQTDWHTALNTTGAAAVVPQVEMIQGEPYLVNPKTGHFEKLNKAPSKQQFISQNLAKWATDRMVEPDEAVRQLSNVYDQINPTTHPATPTNPPPFKVRIVKP